METLVPGRTPTSVRFELTTTCNVACSFCCVSEFTGFRGHPIEKYKAFFDRFPTPDTTTIRFVGGGEPTVYGPFPELVEHLAGRGFRMSLVTNGVRLPSIADSFKHFRGWVCVSVHGLEEVHNRIVAKKVFKRVIAGIKAVQAVNSSLRIFVSCVLCPDNLPILLDMVQYFRDMQIPMRLTPLIETGTALSDADREMVRSIIPIIHRDYPEVQLPPLLRRTPTLDESINAFVDNDDVYASTELDANKVVCRNIYGEAKIKWNGKMQVCKYLHTLGNVFKTPVTKVWNNVEHKTFLRGIETEIAETGNYPRSCLRCCYLEHRNLTDATAEETLPAAMVAPAPRTAVDMSEFVDLDLAEDAELLVTHAALSGKTIIPLMAAPADTQKPSCGC
jgi:molybdenum cofactor biosynthesis enzyme MoaA